MWVGRVSSDGVVERSVLFAATTRSWPRLWAGSSDASTLCVGNSGRRARDAVERDAAPLAAQSRRRQGAARGRRTDGCCLSAEQ